jgi:hypothetical protein
LLAALRQPRLPWLGRLGIRAADIDADFHVCPFTTVFLFQICLVAAEASEAARPE